MSRLTAKILASENSRTVRCECEAPGGGDIVDDHTCVSYRFFGKRFIGRDRLGQFCRNSILGEQAFYHLLLRNIVILEVNLLFARSKGSGGNRRNYISD